MERFRSIGSDPEAFLVRNNEFVSSEGLIGGTKFSPARIMGLPEGYGVQEDNVAIEFNIPPCKTKSEFIGSLNNAITGINNTILHGDYDMVFQASAEFDPMYLDTPHAMKFGCEPDMNAWLGIENPKPCAINTNFRSCGGHVHLSYLGLNEEQNVQIVRVLDLLLAVVSIIYDQDTDRRLLYGKAGSYRDKDYGLEYRTLSNFWLKNNSFMEWVYDCSVEAVNNTDKYITLLESDGLKDRVQETVNNSNVEEAYAIIEQYKLKLAA